MRPGASPAWTLVSPHLRQELRRAANLRSEALDLRGWWHSRVHLRYPGNPEPANLGRDNLSREIGHTQVDGVLRRDSPGAAPRGC